MPERPESPDGPPTPLPRTTGGRLVRVVLAGLIGTTVEWYDFFLYGSAAALVFDKVFFPGSDPLTGTLLALATYAIGFVARPLGGMVFGHYGDRLGRKRLLVVSLLMMGTATFLIGLLPSHAAIGAAAPILLVVLRLVQGFAIGGEWGGAVLIVSEHGDPERRGFWASWPQAGVPLGNLLATAVLAVLAAVQSTAAFDAWGWRIPFLLSAVLVGLGLWIRLRIEESPVYREASERAAARPEPEKAPISRVVRYQWRELLIAMGARIGENTAYYVITAFVIVFAKDRTHLSDGQVLNAVLIASALEFVLIPLVGAATDRIGRRPVLIAGGLGMAVWVYPFLLLVDRGTFGSVTLAAIVALLMHALLYSPQGAYFSELFGTRVRYSGASIGYQLASILAGGIAPLIATALLDATGSAVPIAVYVAAMALVTVVAVALGRETRGRDMDFEAEQAPPASARAAPAGTAKS